MRKSSLLAFDFDGVLCDGLREYFQVAWRTYCQMCPMDSMDSMDSMNQGADSRTREENLDPLHPPEDLFASFAQGRAVIETGWEMPLLLHALREGRSLTDILDRWSEILAEYQSSPPFSSAATIAQGLDGVRDHWIQTDLTGWLALHRFYPGVIERLNTLLGQGHRLAIVSTKEGRFIQQLLAQAEVSFPVDHILGKEVKRPKKETLKGLMANNPHCQSVHFIEDRLAALYSVKSDPDLKGVNLYLAGWGYNTEQDRALARQDDRIQLLTTIEEFTIEEFQP